MAEPSDSPRPFDVRTIRYLVRLMSQNDLSEIDLAEGDRRIRLRRGPRVVPGMAAPLPAMAHPVTTAPLLPAAPPVAAATPAAPARKLIEIKCKAVGTFYAARDEKTPPFVTVGSRVNDSTVVCIIEAMKVFNDIQAECSGVIAEICVNNKDFVDYNTVLFRVDPAG